MTKTIIIKCLIGAVILAWIGLGAAIYFSASKTILFIAATGAAVVTEGAIWVGAALFGLAAYEARAKIVDYVRRKLASAR